MYSEGLGLVNVVFAVDAKKTNSQDHGDSFIYRGRGSTAENTPVANNSLFFTEMV